MDIVFSFRLALRVAIRDFRYNAASIVHSRQRQIGLQLHDVTFAQYLVDADYGQFEPCGVGVVPALLEFTVSAQLAPGVQLDGQRVSVELLLVPVRVNQWHGTGSVEFPDLIGRQVPANCS